MKLRFVVLLAVVAVAVIFSSLLLLGSQFFPSAPRENSVAVTWGLLGEIVYRLSDGEIQVVQLLPPGVEIHDWEPTPEAVREAARSRLLVWTVEGFDDWGARIAGSAGVRSFKASEGVALLRLEEGVGYDVHLWLDPRNVKTLIENLARELSLEFPELAPRIRKNAVAMLGELDRLHEELSIALAPYRGRVLVTQHDAFRYLAEAYSLRVIPVLGHEEEEPTASHIIEVREALEGGCAIYAEDNFVHPIVESLAREFGLRVLMLYTGEGLTLEDVREGKGYVYLMRLNLQALEEGFKCG